MNNKDKIIDTALAVIASNLLIGFMAISVNLGKSTTEVTVALVCIIVVTLLLADVLKSFIQLAVAVGIGLSITVIAVISEPSIETLIGIMIGGALALISSIWV